MLENQHAIGGGNGQGGTAPTSTTASSLLAPSTGDGDDSDDDRDREVFRGGVSIADEPLSMRFTRRSVKLTYTVKTMFGCAFVRRHDHAHYPIYNHTNRNGKVMIGSDPTFSISAHARHSGHVPEYMQIDAGVAGAMMFHYYNKSLEECISRREFRLRPDVACGRKCPQITEHERARRKSVTAQLVRVCSTRTHAMVLL